MDKQTILYVEDSAPQRITLCRALRQRGFSVESAGTVQEARAAIANLKERLAVLVLDMRLDDPDDRDTIGADLGIELRERYEKEGMTHNLPEFLILSAWSLPEYYKAAVRLGVAAYLTKNTTSQSLIIQHIRALLIRRNLQATVVATQIREIADDSRNLYEGTIQFCEETLKPVFSRFLGVPFVIIASDEKRTYVCGDSEALLPQSHPIYKKLQKLVHVPANSDSPLMVNDALLLQLNGGLDTTELKCLVGSVFLPLSAGIRISFGILPGTHLLSEEPESLANTLRPYLLRDIYDPLLRMLGHFIKNRSKNRAALMAQSLTYFAQEQLASLGELAASQGISRQSPVIQKLLALTEEFRDTGQALMPVEPEEVLARQEQISLPDLVELVLADSNEWLPREKVDLQIVQDGSINASKDDLFIALTRILQWFVERREMEQGIWVKIVVEGPQIGMMDFSRRLPLPLRQRLFSPFARGLARATATNESGAPTHYLPLYLAKVLVEVKNNGVLEDCSDNTVENEDPFGHRFVLRFSEPETDIQ